MYLAAYRPPVTTSHVLFCLPFPWTVGIDLGRPTILCGRPLRCGGRRWILLPDSFSRCATFQLQKGLGLGWKGG
ncbi:uncharacterized protein LY79DRAFT_537350 [Colletotrichum navitas]|uniref:Uncharacterized protein n=1 Tax=Colletotrichum navitas TaxID=681940 RepID=A0AAD8QAB4_9PEZI|nr:uncharacterized protein LY79DRAFT_537350 [Colletotrichum navitas]KAK1598509.1 hypothetical protein LY79DRAFT_537350 [Colletotrichum navitas]